MPNWSEILEEIREADAPIDKIRRKYLANLHKVTNRNIIIYYSGWLQKGNLVGTEINDEDKNGFMSAQYKLDATKGLDLILHTPGGETGATESIVDYLHSLYKTDIRAFVPQLALSGGTIIACGCEVIYMGKHSSLGPIDPQIGGIPAHGVIEEFKQAYEEIQEDKDKVLVWQPILSRYNPTLIHSSQKIIERNQEMVIKWLTVGMFKEDPEGLEKSKRIANMLTDTNYTKFHGRHLSPTECKDDIGLKIKMLECDSKLQDAVLSVHHACMHTLTETPSIKIIENHKGKAFIKQGIAS